MKKQRNLDGYRYRILREGKMQIVCISDMNDKEMDTVLGGERKSHLLAMAKGLANRLYQLGEGYDIEL